MAKKNTKTEPLSFNWWLSGYRAGLQLNCPPEPPKGADAASWLVGFIQAHAQLGAQEAVASVQRESGGDAAVSASSHGGCASIGWLNGYVAGAQWAARQSWAR
jgi:hypothetical protein